MMDRMGKNSLKTLLGELPLTAEVYWYIRQPGKPVTAKFSLDRLQAAIPEWRRQAESSPFRDAAGKRVLVVGTLRYWVEYATLVGLTLSGLGHQVTLACQPYAAWQTPIDRFDLRRQNVYALRVLRQAEPLLRVVSFLRNRKSGQALPPALSAAVEEVSYKDTQYTLQMEDVDRHNPLYNLRLDRNLEAAQAAFHWIQTNQPEVIIIPNGTILEFGAIYQVARYLSIPVVTFEFGEQRQRIWLAQDAQVMRQDTDPLWRTRQDRALEEDQRKQVQELFASRQRASLFENFARRWQGVPSEGGERLRSELKLDGRPVVLLATNVIGDSLTLGRQVFSDSMTEWLERTLLFFANRPDVQFIIRIHPGELITKGPSVAGVAQRVAPQLPEHIHLVPADANVNTYDIVEIADLGLVYTTTVGMEMAMSGVPVIVVGNTHYRNKGFTLDPENWEAYFELLGKVLVSPSQYRLSRTQVDQAWNYAYRFFFEYPHPFPWHLVHVWKDLEEWPVQRVLSDEGQARFGKTFRYLVGEPVQWGEA